MGDEVDNAIFQSSRSEFVEMVKFLIKEIIQNISTIEDTLYMQPESDEERRHVRVPYRNFRRSFRELFLMTQQIVRNESVLAAVRVWFNQAYKTDTKDQVFTDGIELAQLYLQEMYVLGLLDLNVSPPVDFPFKDLIEDITIEAERQALLAADITNDEITEVPMSAEDEINDRKNMFNLKYTGETDEAS